MKPGDDEPRPPAWGFTRLFWPALILLLASFEAAGAGQGHDHGDHSPNQNHPAPSEFSAGRPGNPARVKRTIRVRALDTMRFEPSPIRVRRGENVRLRVTNAGRLPHEAVIGSPAEQEAHEAEMQGMQNPGAPREHHHPNAASLAPGATRDLVWQFEKPGGFEIGCHLPGHYRAGMVGRIIVR